MSRSGPDDAPDAGASEVIAFLRQALGAGGYSTGAVQRVLGDDVASLDRTSAAPLLRRRLPPDSSLAVLVELFGLGLAVEVDKAAGALTPLSLDAAVAAGIVDVLDGAVHPLIGIDLHAGLLLARDVGGDVRRSDHVVGLHKAALTVASLTPRTRVASALDVGTGSGVHALLAARHADRVVATDINARALTFARFNAGLNEVSHVEVREGDLFEPVRGERFDLVVCNPPFAVSPESAFAYRDSGLPGDEITRRVATAIPSHLTEGGVGCMIGAWIHRADDDWRGAPRSWFQSSACDVWLLRQETLDAVTYAATWCQTHDPSAFEQRLERWLAYYEEQGIEAVTTGVVLLRRRSSGDNWLRADAVLPDRVGDCTAHLERVFGAETFLADASDADVLACAYSPVEELRVDQRLVPGADGFGLEQATAVMTRGLRYADELDRFALAVLQLCDGRTALEAVCPRLAEAGAVDESTARAAVASRVRRWCALGMVERREV